MIWSSSTTYTEREAAQAQNDFFIILAESSSVHVHTSLVPRPFFLQLNAGSKKGPGIYCMGDSAHASNLTSYF